MPSSVISIIWPALALILGLLIWVLASNGIVKEAGKIMYFWGLGVTLMVLAHIRV